MENDDENQMEICRNKIKEKVKYNIQKKFNDFFLFSPINWEYKNQHCVQFQTPRKHCKTVPNLHK